MDVLNTAVMNELKEIMGEDFVFLLTTYQSDSERKIGEIKSALSVNDLDKLKKITHSLKGSSLNLGIVKLADVSRQIEDHIELNKIDSLLALIDLLEFEFSRAKEAIVAFVK